ncbi:hypothetical protein DFH09DRAFT_1104916 [Mycena vulgaris]|nr:hypothetical protein DFH09DRAFT_1104916 [Mycena vulgaris]
MGTAAFFFFLPLGFPRGAWAAPLFCLGQPAIVTCHTGVWGLFPAFWACPVVNALFNFLFMIFAGLRCRAAAQKIALSTAAKNTFRSALECTYVKRKDNEKQNIKA